MEPTDQHAPPERGLGSRIAKFVRGPLTPILVLNFCMSAGLGMVWTILAVYTSSLGASATMTGLVMASFGGARLFVSIPAGALSERLGRATVMLGGLVLMVAGSVAATVAPNVLLLAGTLLIQGIGSAAFATAAMAAVADLSLPDARIRNMAAFQIASMAGVSVGPGIGGIIAGQFDLVAPFWCQGGMAALGLLVLRRVFAQSRRAGAAPRSTARPKYGRLLRSLAGPALMSYSVQFMNIACNWTLVPLIATKVLDLGMTTVGSVLTAGAITNFLVLPLTPRLAVRLGRRPLILAGSAINLLALAVLATVPSLPAIVACAVLIGIATGLSMPPVNASAADAAPPGQMGTAMGIVRTTNDLAILSSPIIVGFLISNTSLGYDAGIMGAVVVVVATTALFAFLKAAPRPG